MKPMMSLTSDLAEGDQPVDRLGEDALGALPDVAEMRTRSVQRQRIDELRDARA